VTQGCRPIFFAAASSAETIDVLNPCTDQVIGRPAGTPAHVERAVQAAEEGFQAWRWLPAMERAAHLHKE
jgi:succinate-semialdehyde dehydrogenase/glutarate-semialdehyde dehydrogenase